MFGESIWLTAALWMALALISSLISIRVAISAALIEIMVGVLAGNVWGLHPTPWIDFPAGFGSIMLTFLAGAEIDPAALRHHFAAASAIGLTSFLAPFLGCWAYAYLIAGWSWQASQLCGIVLSTTSVAVVYAVLLETRLNETASGKLILAACFITDLGTVIALGLLFSSFDRWMVVFLAVLALALWWAPRVLPLVFAAVGDRLSEPAAKALYALVFLLSGLATQAKSEGVLPAYFLGLAMAPFFLQNQQNARHLRFLTLGFLTPFYFLKAGTYVAWRDAWTGLGLIAVLFTLKIGTKLIGVWPMSRFFGQTPRLAAYTSLLMATGLTFGTIASLFGLTHGIIDRSQYTTLVTVVILSAVIPTLIAQSCFQTASEGEANEGDET